MKKVLATLASLLIFMIIDSAQADLRCDGKIIRPNMKKRDIFRHCGHPSFNYSFTEEIKTTDTNSKEITIYNNKEHLLYDTDSGSFLRTVKIINDEVDSIDKHNEKGLPTSKKPNCLNETKHFKTGLKAEVLGHLCGEPMSKQLLKTELQQTGKLARQIRTEKWIYMNRKKEIAVTIYDGSISDFEIIEY